MGQPCAEKIFINLNSPPAFQLRQKILGDNNANLQYIVQETKANVSLRGRGSGFVDVNGAESNEPLHMLIEHPALKNLIEAKSLAKNLIETIQQDLQIFLQPNQQNQQQTVQIQQPPPIIQTSNQQITIPQAVLSCPPPTIIQQPLIQQQNFIPQQQILSHNVPMQIIQQTPPPIRTSGPIVQFQGQPNLQSANIQIQGTHGGQQILLNQGPAQQFQLQYIPSTNQITNAPQMQTIQHVLQPQQQIQGILQPGASGQQFITVQGNTAFMIPPPNIIQQNAPQSIQHHQVFNAPPQAITLNHEDNKIDPAKHKQDPGNEQQKNNQNLQSLARVTNLPIPLNQPPPILNCPPPQIFNQQGQHQQIQQFIVNTNSWPQQQQLQQLPINSQIQIVTQPQTIRGNEIVIQSPIQHAGQQVITTFNPQQGGQQFQQIQFHQAAITQPPPTQPSIQNAPTSHQSIGSFQQQFEQKINSCGDNQQRSGKRKFENETENESGKMFPKAGMGQSSADQSSPKPKNRMMAPNQQLNQQPPKINVNNTGPSSDKRSLPSKPMYNVANSASAVQKNVASPAESKMSKPTGKNENESSEIHETASFAMQSHPNQAGFMVRSGTQNYRFAGPQNFIHQQPPPISQNSQFIAHRGQIMNNAGISMYQNVGQNQMMQPPPVVTTAGHQFVQQDMHVYQQNNNFNPNSQQGNMNRFNAPQQPQHLQQQQQQQGVENMTGSYQQQQPRFRQW